jgi:voltage-gated potassium channel
MLVLSLLFVVVLVVPLATDLHGAAGTSVTVANVLLWLAFAVDYIARLYLAPARWTFVRTHPID